MIHIMPIDLANPGLSKKIRFKNSTYKSHDRFNTNRNMYARTIVTKVPCGGGGDAL